MLLSRSSSDPGGTLTFAATGLPPGLKINTGTGQITGTVVAGAATSGPYTTTVTASDGTYQPSQSFTWNVTSPVTLNAIPDQTSSEGAPVSLALTSQDSNPGATLAFTATGLPPGLAINTSTGAITGTLAAGTAASGPYSVTVTANDGLNSASQSFTWNVVSGLVLTTPTDQNNNEGDAISLQVQVSGGGANLAYGALGLPAGLSINTATGLISGTLSAGDAANGPYTVTLLANNGAASAQTSFTWNIASPISITPPDDQSNNAGDAVSLAISATGSGTLSYSATGLPPGLSINSSSGAISGTLSTGGAFSPTITAGNGTYSSSVSFNWSVASPITITDPGGQTFNAGDAVSLPILADDSAPGTLSYSASGLPSGLSINSSSGVISGTISGTLAAGLYTSTVTVSDSTNTAQLGLSWTIYAASTVILTNPGTQSSSEGSPASLSLSASYTGSGTLSYAADGLPPGLAINPSTGVISGTPATGDAVLGPYTVTVTASDGSASDSRTFTWNVSSALSLTNPGTQNSTEGGTVSLTLSATGGTPTFAAQGLPPGLALNPTTGVISGTLPAGASANGPYAVTVQASSGSTTVTQSFTWNVSSPVTLAAVADQTSGEGAPVSLTLAGNDTINGATLTYAATGLPPGLTLNPSTGVISGTVATGAAANGPYAVSVLAEDGTYAAAQSFSWNVTSPVTISQPLDQTNNEGDVVSLSLTANDANNGILAFAATGLPSGLVINPGTGQITGTLPAGAAANGPYTVTVGATDGSNSGQTSFTWNVNSPITIIQPADQTSAAGGAVSLQISANDVRSGTLQYSASGLPNGLSLNSSSGLISGTLAASGSFSPTVTVTDGTYSNSVALNWTVTGPVTITDPGDQSNAEGDSVSLQVTAGDYTGGTLTYTATGLPPGLSISSSGLISGTVTVGDAANGPYAVTITASDGSNTAVDTFNWDVSPASVVVLTNPGNQTNAAGDEVAFFLQASDSSGGTVMYSASGLPAGLHINADTGLIFGTLSSSAVSGTPYTISVQASDGVNSAAQTFNWTVNAAAVATLTNPGDQTSNEGAAVNLALTSSDSGGTLSFVAFGLPPGLTINPSSGTISGTLAAGASANGPYTVTVVGNDGAHTASQTFAWNVNSPVTLAGVSDQTNNEGDAVSLALSGNDTITGATLHYAAFGLPAGLAINPSTGVISGTVAKGTAASGPYSVTVVDEDGTYSASQTFTWNVNSPITFTTPADQSNNEGDVVSLAVSAVDSTPGATLSYAAVGLPAGLSINSTTGVISGTVATGNAGIGSFSPTITASDGTSSTSITLNWDISSALSLPTPSDQASTVGDTVSLSVVATDTGGTPTYTASGLPAGLSINPSTGLISGTISSAATAIGSYQTTVTADDGSRSASVNFNWVVSAAGTITMTTPANQTSAEGALVSLSLSATGGGTKRYFAEGLPAGLEINPSTGVISGTLPVGAAAAGPYVVTVIATDGTNVAVETVTWTVTSTATLAAVPDQTSTEGAAVSLSLTGNDTGGTLQYAAYGLPPGLAINPSTGQITGTVALGASAAGPYAVTVVAADGTAFAVQTFTWTVNSPITLTAPADQTNTEGDTPSLTVSATGGGTRTFSATGLPPGLVINPSNGTISGTIAPGASANSPYTVVVTASDGMYSTSQTLNWSVNSPISIMNLGQQNVVAGSSVSLQVSAQSSLGGTLSASAFNLPGGLTINSNGFVSGTLQMGAINTGTIISIIRFVDQLTGRVFTWVQPVIWNVIAPGVLPTILVLPGAPPVQPGTPPGGTGKGSLGLPPGGDLKAPQSYETWRDMAQAYINALNPRNPGYTKDIYELNKRRTAAYRNMFQQGTPYLWAGAAAIASNGVGEALEYFKDWQDKTFRAYVINLLSDGNKAIYNDLFWQLFAYRAGGLAELQRKELRTHIAPLAMQGWEKIAAGQKMGGEAGHKLVLQGTMLLFQHEQRDVLQKVIDNPKNRQMRQAAKFLSGYAVASMPGLPKNAVSFWSWTANNTLKNKKGEPDFGNVDQRIAWMTQVMQAWGNYAQKDYVAASKYVGTLPVNAVTQFKKLLQKNKKIIEKLIEEFRLLPPPSIG